ncbi:Histone acetyltransferase [Venturia inaequalis]|nr:Histone acetyltransferase [Venturia inaequalis]
MSIVLPDGVYDRFGRRQWPTTQIRNISNHTRLSSKTQAFECYIPEELLRARAPGLLQSNSTSPEDRQVLLLFGDWIFSGTLPFQGYFSSPGYIPDSYSVLFEAMYGKAWQESLNSREKIINSAFYDSYRAELLRHPKTRPNNVRVTLDQHIVSLVHLYCFAESNSITTLREDTLQAIRICIAVVGQIPQRSILNWIFTTIPNRDESDLGKFFVNLYYDKHTPVLPYNQIVQQADTIHPTLGAAILSRVSVELKSTQLRVEQQAAEILRLQSVLESHVEEGTLNAAAKHERDDESDSEEEQSSSRHKLVKMEESDMP